MTPRLGVNIDHVATLRQARGEDYPSIVDAAKMTLSSGADQITIHLREDRRHIQDTDVEAVQLVTTKYGKPLNLEMGCDPEIVEVAIATAPEWICLVPENRMERTTEGGLNLLDSFAYQRVENVVKAIREKLPQTKISLFLEAKEEILSQAVKLNVDAVEIHTGDYAMAYQRGEALEKYFEQFEMAKNFLKEHSVAHHAGHGLTYDSVKPLVEKGLFVEYNIGHWIICQSVFDGLGNVVSKLKALLSKKY